jgi:hypothetical protein
VERINIVEPDNRPALVLANSRRIPNGILEGREQQTFQKFCEIVAGSDVGRPRLSVVILESIGCSEAMSPARISVDSGATFAVPPLDQTLGTD